MSLGLARHARIWIWAWAVWPLDMSFLWAKEWTWWHCAQWRARTPDMSLGLALAWTRWPLDMSFLRAKEWT